MSQDGTDTIEGNGDGGEFEAASDDEVYTSYCYKNNARCFVNTGRKSFILFQFIIE